jgi:beta-glucosidase
MPGTPLYPFGYGLSYTHFEYSNLHVEPAEIHPGGEARVTLDVKNTGDRAGVETVQLYLHEKYAPVSTPVKQLRGFERVALDPGESKTVTLKLTPKISSCSMSTCAGGLCRAILRSWWDDRRQIFLSRQF